MTNKIVLSALVAGALALATNPADAGEKWSFQIEPYMIGASIEGDVGVGRATGAEVDVDFGDILDNLDLGGMAHFEAHHKNGWGFALDYAFMDLSDDLGGPAGGVIGAEVFQGIFEAVVVKSTRSGSRRLDYFGGLRWWNTDIDVSINPAVLPGSATAGVDVDWIDAIIGVRWRNPLGEKWSFSLRGDVGAGGADFTWKAVTGFRYRIGNSKALDLGYLMMGVDYEDGTPGVPGYFQYDTLMHGPAVGFQFKF